MGMANYSVPATSDQTPEPNKSLDSRSSAQDRPLLEVRGLSTGYGETQALWDISLEVMRGEIVAVIGANGAGKSTLLSALSGLLPIWEGTIAFAGHNITHARAERVVRLGLAHVPQGRRLFAGLTVEENLKLGAYTRRAGSASAIRADLERVYAFLPKLNERRTQLAGSLSGGEQQMCALARGLMSRPDLLLVDELSSGLAPKVIDDILAALDNIHRQERLSLLLVEQDVQIALERANRGYVIENGLIALSGPAQELLKSAQVRMAYLRG